MSKAVNDLRVRVSSNVVQEKRPSGSVIRSSATGCDQALVAIGRGMVADAAVLREGHSERDRMAAFPVT